MAKITIEIDDDIARGIEALAEKCGMEPKMYFASALRLLEAAIQVIEEGRVLAAVDEKGQRYRPIMMPAFDTTKWKRNG